jgi:DNA-binding IclR family transcriptional regulator
MIQQTSVEAYEGLVVSGKVNKRQVQVLDILNEHPFPMTSQEISVMSGLPINCVTPRVKELREKGYVVQAFKKADSITGRRAIAWKVAKVGT